jgi:hypothetical protein
MENADVEATTREQTGQQDAGRNAQLSIIDCDFCKVMKQM